MATYYSPLGDFFEWVRFEFHSAKSHKFWKIRVRAEEMAGCRLRVCWGRAGTQGQEKAWKFGTRTRAIEEAEKKCAAKLAKGYTKSDVSATAAAKPSYGADGRPKTKRVAVACFICSKRSGLLYPNSKYLHGTKWFCSTECDALGSGIGANVVAATNTVKSYAGLTPLDAQSQTYKCAHCGRAWRDLPDSGVKQVFCSSPCHDAHKEKQEAEKWPQVARWVKNWIKPHGRGSLRCIKCGSVVALDGAKDIQFCACTTRSKNVACATAQKRRQEEVNTPALDRHHREVDL